MTHSNSLSEACENLLFLLFIELIALIQKRSALELEEDWHAM
jgi:hypothetical protein